MRSIVNVLAVALAATSLVAAAGAGHPGVEPNTEHTHAGVVAAGPVGAVGDDSPLLFWESPAIECDGDPDAGKISAPSSCDKSSFLHWSFEVSRTSAELLRVDWDQPMRQDDFELLLFSPMGDRVSAISSNSYSGGAVYEFPFEGTWTIEFRPIRTDGTTVRLRAGLTDLGASDFAPGSEELLPNLRVTPPFEFGFAAPINPTNSLFLAGDDVNPAIDVAGQRPVSCTADEVQEASDPTRRMPPTALVRCLRFTAGPHNAGAGHFDLRFPIVTRATSDRDRLVEMTQVVHHADGSLTERPAGTYEFHVTHGHYHYTDILFYELLAVDAPGETRVVGLGNKSGFCPADQGYAEWTSLAQAKRFAIHTQQPGDCLSTNGGNGAMGLSAGWGDFYRWQRPGQYVDFTLQPDGDYVVRTTVDVHDHVLETDESDNAAYAWIRVTGDDVEVLERGRGASPWDPAKVVVNDGRDGN